MAEKKCKVLKETLTESLTTNSQITAQKDALEAAALNAGVSPQTIEILKPPRNIGQNEISVPSPPVSPFMVDSSPSRSPSRQNSPPKLPNALENESDKDIMVIMQMAEFIKESGEHGQICPGKIGDAFLKRFPSAEEVLRRDGGVKAFIERFPEIFWWQNSIAGTPNYVVVLQDPAAVLPRSDDVQKSSKKRSRSSPSPPLSPRIRRPRSPERASKSRRQ